MFPIPNHFYVVDSAQLTAQLLNKHPRPGVPEDAIVSAQLGPFEDTGRYTTMQLACIERALRTSMREAVLVERANHAHAETCALEQLGQLRAEGGVQ